MTRVLKITAGEQSRELVIGPREVSASPPGVVLGPFLPPLTLAEVQAQRRLPLDTRHATAAHLRKLRNRWEVFFECVSGTPTRGGEASLTPGFSYEGGAGITDPSSTSYPFESFAHWAEVRGVEAVTLLIGPEDYPTAALTVPEKGMYTLFAGVNDGSLEVHRQSHESRWYCRVVLPDSWLPMEGLGRVLLIGCRRSHGDSEAAETAPGTGPPFRHAPDRAAVNLDSWDERP